jgi:hypothetical protein
MYATIESPGLNAIPDTEKRPVVALQLAVYVVRPATRTRILLVEPSHTLDTVVPSSLYTFPDMVIEAVLSSHTMYPGSPSGSLSYASPAIDPEWFVNLHELTEEPSAVTLNPPTPVVVANTLLVKVFAGFVSMTDPSTVIAESPLLEMVIIPYERSCTKAESLKDRPREPASVTA